MKKSGLPEGSQAFLRHDLLKFSIWSLPKPRKCNDYTIQAHMATKKCVHTLSLSLESTQSLCRLAAQPHRRASQPTGLPNHTSQAGTQPVVHRQPLHRDSGFISLGPSQAHILPSWHSSRIS